MTRHNKLNLGQLLAFGGGLYLALSFANALAQWNTIFLLGTPIFFIVMLYGVNLRKEAEAEFRREHNLMEVRDGSLLRVVELPKESS